MPTATPVNPKDKANQASAISRPADAAAKKIAAKHAAKSSSDASSITNYTTALRWLYEHMDHERMRIVRYNERTFNLDRMRKLLSLIGNPHEQLKTVQVAGTKGKGSTCAMLASMLKACGYTVGLYTSPHLVDLRERITIDGNMISYNEVAELFKLIASKEKAFGSTPPTFFEIMTAAAMRYFADQAVDVAVLETGLGGRLDCTTVVDPMVTGIAQISLDHMNILGNDLASIAREKAGIFKKNVPALSVAQEPQVVAVLKEVAETVGAPLQFTGEQIDFSYRFEANRELGPHTRVCLTTPTSKFEHLAVPLRGEHQAHNCGLALAMLDRLKGHGFTLPEEKVIVGLSQTQLAGRMEQVWSEPRIIIDGAHNACSIQALIRALGAHITYDSLVMIFGCGQDKDVNGMLKQVALGADKVIFTRAKNNPRAMEPEDLLHQFTELSGKMAQTAPTLVDALKLSARAVSREDLIIVTGSFYLAGEARKYFADATAKRKR
jgi:dihydrofolate synthase/folylpolyglutamate synthase